MVYYSRCGSYTAVFCEGRLLFWCGDFLEGFFATQLGQALYLIGISMLPIIELRGGIPVGALNGIPWVETYLLCVIGNMLPVPFIILFVRRVFDWMKKKSARLGRLAERFETKFRTKAANVVKYEMLGLLLFVAIPLPGTGAWTGAGIAAFLNMRLKHALPVIFGGVLIAGFIMSGISYGFLSFLNFLA